MAGRVFLALWVFVLIVASAFQLVVIPELLPHLHAGHGLLAGFDSLGFHELAVAQVESVRQYGWGQWSLRPGGQGPAGIASLVYWATGIERPFVLIPIHAALFALAGLFCFKTVVMLFGHRVAWVGMIPFFVFPSALEIYGQIHKDIWVMAGVSILVFLVTSVFLGRVRGWKSLIGLLGLASIGASFIWLMKPYVGLIMVPGLLGVIVLYLLTLHLQAKRSLVFGLSGLVFITAILIIVGIGHLDGLREPSIEPAPQVATQREPSIEPAPEVSTEDDGLTWQPSTYLPARLDSILFRIASNREYWREAHPVAGSAVDEDVSFESASDIFWYLPRGLQIATLAPFPDMWFGEAVSPGGQIKRWVSAYEMSIAYVALIALVIYLIKARSLPIMALLIMTMAPATILTLVQFFVGGLYRYRYPFWILWVSLGLVALAALRVSYRESKMRHKARDMTLAETNQG